MSKEAKIVQFQTRENRDAERRFRHLSDHLFKDPCRDCIDKESEFCERECSTGIRKAIIANVIKNTKSF